MMQIVCPACGKRLQISDEKLPIERQVRIACPSCQERFVFEPQSASVAGASAAFAVPAIIPAPGAGSTGLFPPMQTLNIDIIESGPAPRALICLDTPSHRDECENMMPALGFNTVHVMNNQVQALTQLTQVAYDCVILDALFDGSSQEANPILACVSELPMQQRRHMIIALCGIELDASDGMFAYSQSVNLIIDHADILHCRRTLEKEMALHKRTYTLFDDIRQELGKE
jgi:predicted Zn finger-like uncharacterized protein